MEAAKEQLGDAIERRLPAPASPAVPPSHEPARSKLNTLLGTTSVPRRTLGLFQNVGVEQRPTYDLIAHRVLGPDVGATSSFLDEGSAYADHVAQRLRSLRERLEHAPPQDEEPGDGHTYVGLTAEGQPVWSQILDEQRSRAVRHTPKDLSPPPVGDRMHAATMAEPVSSWPARMRMASHQTFKQWFVAEENFEATQYAETLIDHPGQRFNPLVVVGDASTGVSHLLRATGQALLRRAEGHVLFVSAADRLGHDGLDVQWQGSLTGAVALVVDDVHEFASDATWSHQLGVLIDQALNLGVQVIVGGRGSPETYAPSRLKEVLRAGCFSTLMPPTPHSLLAYGQWRCAQRNILMSNVHLAQLARAPPHDWRAMEHRISQVALALEQGAVLLDHDHVETVLNPAPPSNSEHQQQRVDDLATQLVSDALDTVYSSLDTGGIDLYAGIADLGEEDYQPPDWDEETLHDNSRNVLADQWLRTVEQVKPAHPSVLDVHEREQLLLATPHPLNHQDLDRAVDVLVDLDEAMDRRMERSTANSQQVAAELHQLEERMVELAQLAVDADIESLIEIADQLREVEERLVELDPDREPLPPFEDSLADAQASDSSSSPNRSPGRRRASRRSTARPTPAAREPSPNSSLDEYEPEGEWNIDGEGIVAEDVLLDDSVAPQRVRLARLKPTVVLRKEDEV